MAVRYLVAGIWDKRRDGIAWGQLYAFHRFRRQIARRLGATFEYLNTDDLDAIAAACDSAAERVAGFVVRPNYKVDPGKVMRFYADLRARHPRHRIVHLDPWDQTTGRFLGVLPHVDKVLKYVVLKNRDDYYKPMHGGTPLSDYLVRERGFDLQGWYGASEVAPGLAQRIMAGTHIIATRRFQFELLKPLVWPFYPMRREIDIVCHVSLGNRGEMSYYARHRLDAIEAIQALSGECVTRYSAEYDGERSVSRRQYLHDMRCAKIAVSPFGWGENSTRSYEAAAFGNLLMSPRVDHISVVPDIFVPGETYVPLKWDFSDLGDQVRHYLAHWDEAQRMIDKARQACRAYYAEQQYLEVVAEALGLPFVRQGAAASRFEHAPAEPNAYTTRAL